MSVTITIDEVHTHWSAKNNGFHEIFRSHVSAIIWLYFEFLSEYKFANKIEKQTIIKVQENPKTQPDGVQGALVTPSYHEELTPGSVHKAPMASPVKFRRRNPKKEKK